MEQKENRKIRYTKMVIRDSLMDLMKNSSILNISIKDICEHADISRSTFYSHYKDQYQLLRQIEDEIFVYLEDLLSKYDDKRSNREFTRLIEEILTYAANNSSVQVLLSEHGDIDFSKKLFTDLTIRKHITSLFPRKMQEDETRTCYFIFVLNGCIGLIQHWIKNNMQIPVHRLARMMYKWTEQQSDDVLKL